MSLHCLLLPMRKKSAQSDSSLQEHLPFLLDAEGGGGNWKYKWGTKPPHSLSIDCEIGSPLFYLKQEEVAHKFEKSIWLK